MIGKDGDNEDGGGSLDGGSATGKGSSNWHTVVGVPVAAVLRGCALTAKGAAPAVVSTPTTKPTILVVSILLAQLGEHYFAPHKARTERALNDRETFASTPPVTP